MPRLGLRFSTLALGTLFFFVLAGVYTADRILSDSDKAHASIDAVESASLLESFLAVHAGALTAFHGLYPAPNVPVRRERFAALVRALGEHVSGFRRIWLTDSSGVVRYEVPVAAGEASLAPGLDLDTVPMLDLRAAAQRARLTRRAQVSRPGTLFGGAGGRGFVVLEPIYVDEQFVG